jgi:hypothetical protein
MRSELVLLTAPDATLPADGAILVSRREVEVRDRAEADEDEKWKVKDGQGHDVALTNEDLGSAIERWVPTSAADRDLVIFDHAGKKIATLHQTKARSGHLAAPQPKSLTSDASLSDQHSIPMGVPGGSMSLELGDDPPADARFLTIAITGTGARVHSAFKLTGQQRKFEATAYAHKSCSRGGPAPIFIGEHVALTWVDSLGRRSAVAAATVAKQR